MADNTPIYNLKVVIKETGLSPAALRAWERRYGLIKPQRSPGGHRLYSRQDINLLKWLIARQKEGLSISSAVEMWKSRLNEDRAVLSPAQELPAISGTNILGQLRDQWLASCLAFDEQAANQVLDQAFAISSPEKACMEVLQQGLGQIGNGWYQGQVIVQQEHFASAIAMRRLDVLLAALPAPARLETILLACPPGEEHDFILLLITYLLRRSGWNAIYLGSNVPTENLDSTIKTTHPSLVISAAQTLAGAAALSEMSQYLLSQGIRTAFGGGIFTLIPDLSQRISGYYLGTDLAALIGIIELLIVAPPDMPNIKSPSIEYIHLLDRFNHESYAIMSRVDKIMRSGPVEPAYVGIANRYLTQLISSALRLGDIHLMNFSISWLNGFLETYGFSKNISRQYYVAYQQALADQMGDEGALIRDWFEFVH